MTHGDAPRYPLPRGAIERLRMRIADLRHRGIYRGAADQHQAIFVHIPNTAGSSIAGHLFDAPSAHRTCQDYLDANPAKFRRYYKFCFVRNPWDRLVSTFFFLKAGGMNADDRAFAAATLGRFDEFNDFVCDWLTPENIWRWVHFYPQYYFTTDSEGTDRVDFVGRFESIDADFATIAERFGANPTLPVANRSDRPAFGEVYTAESRARVEAVYAEDIRRFRYAFPAD